MQRMRLTSTLAFVVIALAAAGCGGGDEESGGDTIQTTTTTETPPASGDALAGSVGPGFVISVTTPDGQSLGTLAPGTYELEVEDMSPIHNFHLTGPGGVDVSTSVGDEGTESFQVELQPGTYRFVCDPHASTMNGSFEVG